jgi:hypothetical protein
LPKSFEALEKASGSFPNLRIVLVSPKSFASFKGLFATPKASPVVVGVGIIDRNRYADRFYLFSRDVDHGFGQLG